MPYEAFLHSHVSTWAIGLILFLIALILLRTNKLRGLKVVHMILRLFYILIFLTGIGLLFHLSFPLAYVIKAILAFWLIYLMEMVLVKGAKGQLAEGQKMSYSIQIIVALILIFLIGYRVIVF